MRRPVFADDKVPAHAEPPPTDEQVAILDHAKGTGNIMIRALAGAGKTTTIKMAEGVIPEKPLLYMVFNKRNQIEAEKRMASTTTSATFNSVGHRAWARTIAPNLTLDKDKMHTIYRSMIDEVKDKDTVSLMWDCKWEVLNAVARAKATGYVPDNQYPNAKRLLTRDAFHRSLEEDPDEFVAGIIDAVLSRSIKAAYKGLINFDDQIYMPTLFGGSFPKFPHVAVDEYQDLNPVNHAMLDRLVANRITGVGDPWQNIYGFRGARASGMEAAEAKFKMTVCNLSASFRCPERVVEAARWRVPHFKWVKAGGHVEDLNETGGLLGTDIPDNSTFLCRNNAPLFRLAFQMLSAGRSVRVAGSEIGPKIVAIMKKLGDGSTPKAELLGLIEDWRDAKLEKSSTSANDIADSMKIFAGFGTTLAQAITYAEHLFQQKGNIQLMTGHKAKGLEFPRVYLLDPWLLGEDDQDLNLRYVMQTRSSDQLYEIDSVKITI